MRVSLVLCTLPGTGLREGSIPRPGDRPTECGCLEMNLIREKLNLRRPRAARAVEV